MSGEVTDEEETALRRAWVGVGVPILGLIFTVILLAIATLAGFSREHDRAYVESSNRLATGGLANRTHALANVAVDYAHWNDAYEAISVRWDQAWVNDNMYSSVADGMIVMGANGAVRYVWFSEESEAVAQSTLQAAVAAVRRAPNLGASASVDSLSESVSGALVRDGETLVIAAIAAVSPEDELSRAARRAATRTDYLILIDIITEAELAEIGAARDLRDFSFVVSPPRGNAYVSRPVAAADGEIVGYLVWRHLHPGPAAFSRQIWPVIISLLCIGALAILVARLLVTHQVRAIARARDAHAANRAKSEFLARVSQELRTPLNAIIGYAEMIEEEASSPEARGDAAHIISSARHLGQLLNDIIDQSRVDSGRISFHSEVLPVSGLLAEVLGLLRPTADAAGVTIESSRSPLADFVYADHVRLRQCLTNIIGNAIKFSERGAVVAVRARTEKRGARSMIVFDVIDTGIGIAVDEQENIFRPFGQANAGIGKTYGGTGLGLSITRELARQMDGDISMVSEFGRGSTFSLAMPALAARVVRAA